ncbi:hydrolase [Clostridium tetani]|uniref:MBL fold metallo-hydrolase n=2 Tax=Clostridium tetani TaxID=1513 RepID=A0ABY0ERY8_CLOTA|nr:hydrolase [Clostridium tetani]RXI54276.1 MBL fold metallo-hydrolase [Clostridium tetani]RXI68938.1 MBL fold metallo-hydrolase [Clostridium tetani]
MDMNNETKLILLGTGTPNADPDRSGASVAVVVGDNSYIVDFGPGVVRQAAKAYKKGVHALLAKNLKTAFLTHLHSDHTTGYPDLIFTPWVLEREEPLKVFGPKGLKSMTEHILAAYKMDIDERVYGLEPANKNGWKVDVTEIESGVIFEDEKVTVEAFPVKHGAFEAYSYKFHTPDKTIVISGDTAPVDIMVEIAKGCDILVHEVYHFEGFKSRTEEWRKYHSFVHTSSYELGEIAQKAKPKLVVLYHQLYMMNMQSEDENLSNEIALRDKELVEEVKSKFSGNVVSGKDLDIF